MGRGVCLLKKTVVKDGMWPCTPKKASRANARHIGQERLEDFRSPLCGYYLSVVSIAAVQDTMEQCMSLETSVSFPVFSMDHIRRWIS